MLKRLIAFLADLRVAIVLLLVIALASALGTAIPQGDPASSYIEAYADTPWLGLLHGEQVLQLQLDHVYSSGWFPYKKNVCFEASARVPGCQGARVPGLSGTHI